ncbi:MAG: HEAT repeat domain-containing protein [Candidatus Poribacteria bacterium]|nr:HEAT repeat domain-containing protein [Candidatus Poribacteria bacterium]
MTEISFKGVLRSTTVMFLSVGLVGIWICGCETQGQTDREQKVERLIKELQDQDVRGDATEALVQIGKDAVPALVQALQDQNEYVRNNAAWALGEMGTPEALKAVKEYQSRK